MATGGIMIRIAMLTTCLICIASAAGAQTVKLCVPDYDVIDHVTVVNSRRRSPPPHGTPTPGMLAQSIPVPPTRTPLPVGLCPDMDPGSTGYVEVPVTTSLARRGLTNTWTAWSVSVDDVASDASNTTTPPRNLQRAPRLLP